MGLIVLCIALFIASPFFLRVNNLLNILDQVTILGILALGMTFVIVTGGIDLSVGAIFALSMMVLGWTSHNAGWPLGLSILVAVAVGGEQRGFSRAPRRQTSRSCTWRPPD